MPSHRSQHTATLGEKVDFILAAAGVVIVAGWASLRYALSAASNSQPTLAQEISRSIVRWLLDRFNVAQIQWVLPASSVAYNDWIAKKANAGNASPEVLTEILDEQGAKLHWVGRRDAKKVILHYHGGGFIMPLHIGHIDLVNYFRREIKNRSGVEVKLAFLEYTLTPYATYPTQFRQAALALQRVLASGVSPKDIVISGDSAGGLLAFQIISHILHPHPSLPLIPIPSVPFAGILAMSSWVTFDSTAPSFVNNDKDTLSSAPIRTWGRMVRYENVLAGSDGIEISKGYWMEPLKAPPEWWTDTYKVTNNVLLTYGQWEALRDDNVEFAKKFRQGVMGSKVQVIVEEERRGLHVGPTMDTLMGHTPSDLTKMITGWVHDRVVN